MRGCITLLWGNGAATFFPPEKKSVPKIPAAQTPRDWLEEYRSVIARRMSDEVIQFQAGFLRLDCFVAH
jgi:hypothetical protein